MELNMKTKKLKSRVLQMLLEKCRQDEELSSKVGWSKNVWSR